MDLPDLQIVRLVADARATREVLEGEIEISGSLGGQILVWEYATAVAGRLLAIDPFNQPDVESAKVAARALLDARPEPNPAVARAQPCLENFRIGDREHDAMAARCCVP